jgi:hypothetical protein
VTDRRILVREREHLGDLGGTCAKAVPAFDAPARGVELLQNGLGMLPVGPQIRCLGVGL